MSCLPTLGCLNFPTNLNEIAVKLPRPLTKKWSKIIVDKSNSSGEFPSFTEFTEFIKYHSSLANDPNALQVQDRRPPRNLRTLATATTSESSEDRPAEYGCPLHETDSHSIQECKTFSRKTLKDKQEFIRRHVLCYKCLLRNHTARSCDTDVKCQICQRDHLTMFHANNRSQSQGTEQNIQSMKTQVPENQPLISCSKTILVDVFHAKKPHHSMRVFAILDEQSNRSLVSPEITQQLNLEGEEVTYNMNTCNGERSTQKGQLITGLKFKGIKGEPILLPPLFECNYIPDSREDIPTYNVVNQIPHLRKIAKEFPESAQHYPVALLIGRDVSEALEVKQIINGPSGSPYAHRLSLGWTVTGQTGWNRKGRPAHIRTLITQFETFPLTGSCKNCQNIAPYTDKRLFEVTSNDEEKGHSPEDIQFLNLMETQAVKTKQGQWQMPLPFKDGLPILRSNVIMVIGRFNTLLKKFKEKPELREDYFQFM